MSHYSISIITLAFVFGKLLLYTNILGIDANNFVNYISNNNNNFKLLKFKLIDDFTKVKESITKNLQASNKYKRVIDVHDGPIPKDKRKFVINGWRWHTISVLYDLDRYLNIIKKAIDISDDTIESKSTIEYENYISKIYPCCNFVCKFNLYGLHKVEKEIFIPFLENLLPQSIRPLLADMILRQENVQLYSNNIQLLCKSLYTSLSESSLSTKEKALLIKKNKIILYSIDTLIKSIKTNIIATKSIQDDIIIPYITSHISTSQQEIFNNRVINKLGLLDSQVYLVSMYEGIKEYPEEILLYHSQIPSIALKLLPFWKKRLYLPKTQCLEL